MSSLDISLDNNGDRTAVFVSLPFSVDDPDSAVCEGACAGRVNRDSLGEVNLERVR